MSLFVSLSALWMYRYVVYAILDGVDAGTLFLFHYLKKEERELISKLIA
jgi:cytochrome bd-type quinol oxidase subunit 2